MNHVFYQYGQKTDGVLMNRPIDIFRLNGVSGINKFKKRLVIEP
jgi:hypothetical protein